MCMHVFLLESSGHSDGRIVGWVPVIEATGVYVMQDNLHAFLLKQATSREAGCIPQQCATKCTLGGFEASL